MGTLVVLLTSQISDLRTKVTVGNRKGAMLTWPFQNVPSSGSLSPSFTDGSLLTTESVSSWMWVHWCYPILKWAVWQGRIFCSQISAFACSGASKLPMVLDEAPPSPKEFHTKDMMGCPETKTSDRVICDPRFHHTPFVKSCSLHKDPNHTAASRSSWVQSFGGSLGTKPQCLFEVFNDSTPQHTLEFHLAISVLRFSFRKRSKHQGQRREKVGKSLSRL